MPGLCRKQGSRRRVQGLIQRLQHHHFRLTYTRGTALRPQRLVQALLQHLVAMEPSINSFHLTCSTCNSTPLSSHVLPAEMQHYLMVRRSQHHHCLSSGLNPCRLLWISQIQSWNGYNSKLLPCLPSAAPSWSRQ